MHTPDTTAPTTPQQQKAPKRAHTAITLHPDVLAKVDAECDAKRGEYEYTKSRSDIIESSLRIRYGMPQVPMGRKKKMVEAIIREGAKPRRDA